MNIQSKVQITNKIIHGPSLKNLTEGVQLCQMLFAHPEQYSPAQKQLKNDVDVFIEFPIDNSRPLLGSLYVQPWDQNEIYITKCEPNMEVCFDVRMVFPDLHTSPDLRLTIGYGLAGIWPEMPVIVVPHKE